MRFDNNFKFFYSFKDRVPNYMEFITEFDMPNDINSLMRYSSFTNQNYGELEEPHSKIKYYGPSIFNMNEGNEYFLLKRIYVYETIDDMNRDFIANCNAKEKNKLSVLIYKKRKLKGEL